MGMAASQARLLTITARLADNELRSQTINNAKMRLATQSAQASNEYVSALNNSQLMFTNTNENGLSQTVPLTFNTLSQYSQYNNQYGLINNSGQILVSEEDAKIFADNSGNLENFLKAHGLEWETTFFDESSGILSDKITSYYAGEDTSRLFSGLSNEELKNLYLDSISTDASIEKLNYENAARNFYQIIRTIEDEAYIQLRNEAFDESNSNFTEDKIIEALAGMSDIESLKNELMAGNTEQYDTLICNNGDGGDNGAKFALNYLENYLSADGYIELYNMMREFEYRTTDNGVAKASNGQNIVDHVVSRSKITDHNLGTEKLKTSFNYQSKYDDDGNLVVVNDDFDKEDTFSNGTSYTFGLDYYTTPEKSQSGGDNDKDNFRHITITVTTGIDERIEHVINEKDYPGTTHNGECYYTKGPQYTTIQISGLDDDTAVNKFYYTGAVSRLDGGALKYNNEGKVILENGVVYRIPNIEKFAASDKFDMRKNQDSEEVGAINSLLTNITMNGVENNYFQVLKLRSFIDGPSDNQQYEDEEKDNPKGYQERPYVVLVSGYNEKEVNNDNGEKDSGAMRLLAEEYMQSIYDNRGTFNLYKYAQNNNDLRAKYPEVAAFEQYGVEIEIPSQAGCLIDFAQMVEKKKLSLGGTINKKMESVLKSYMTDKMVEAIGEPKYGWVDKSLNPTNNPDAKAQWLTNLFNRMQKGYKVLENGLANSKEWIEYAFTSGLVRMEQVDLSYNWISTDYKCCANITEQTDNSAIVAMAEAKYNRAMNDIKQKDSMYDLELKNIDTEHNALQTEYDVIKSVIKSNVERTMKFNQNA